MPRFSYLLNGHDGKCLILQITVGSGWEVGCVQCHIEMPHCIPLMLFKARYKVGEVPLLLTQTGTSGEELPKTALTLSL